MRTAGVSDPGLRGQGRGGEGNRRGGRQGPSSQPTLLSTPERRSCKLKSLLGKEPRWRETGKRQHLFNQRSELQPLMNSRFPGTPGQVWVERSQKTPAFPCTPPAAPPRQGEGRAGLNLQTGAGRGGTSKSAGSPRSGQGFFTGEGWGPLCQVPRQEDLLERDANGCFWPFL